MHLEENLNEAHTLDTQLNVFADFRPVLSADDRRQPFLFLGNIHPELQYQVLDQMEERPKVVAGDTMNFWIDGSRGASAVAERPYGLREEPQSFLYTVYVPTMGVF